MSEIVLTQYTDPNCTWSWGAEPIMRHIETRYGDQLEFEFVVGGLVRDFDEFHDGANEIEEPADVAPHWEEASGKHGMPVDVAVWEEAPPRSTYPACMATKAAELQDPRLGLRYLRRLREVTATEVRNIAKRSTLVEVGESVGVDTDRLVEALDDGRAERAFREDLGRMRQRGVRGFPTFELTVGGEPTILGTYQPFENIERTLLRRVPTLEPRKRPPLRAFIDAYGYVATREVAEVYGRDRRRAEEALEELADAGEIESVRRGNGRFWLPKRDGDVVRRGTGELSRTGELPWREAVSGEGREPVGA